MYLLFLLASCKLEQITNALKGHSINGKSAKHLSMLLTQNSRALDFSLTKEIEYRDFCNLLCFASTKCPVFHIIIQAVLYKSLIFVSIGSSNSELYCK